MIGPAVGSQLLRSSLSTSVRIDASLAACVLLAAISKNGCVELPDAAPLAHSVAL